MLFCLWDGACAAASSNLTVVSAFQIVHCLPKSKRMPKFCLNCEISYNLHFEINNQNNSVLQHLKKKCLRSLKKE